MRGGRHPVLLGRAPLRHALVGAARAVAVASSRPTRTGSIAARPGARLGAAASDEVIPSYSDGLHCGNLAVLLDLNAEIVIPSYSDGLHCGERALAADAQVTAPSSRPTRTGSIAATGNMQDHPASSSVIPSYSDGLHCGIPSAENWNEELKVIPSYSDGLHCGLWCCHAIVWGIGVIPSYSDGLQCGALDRPLRRDDCERHPVLLGRAPLRRSHLGAVIVRIERSSRPTRTGSIAAGNLGLPCHLLSWSSRPTRTGSIAAKLSGR